MIHICNGNKNIIDEIPKSYIQLFEFTLFHFILLQFKRNYSTSRNFIGLNSYENKLCSLIYIIDNISFG